MTYSNIQHRYVFIQLVEGEKEHTVTSVVLTVYSRNTATRSMRGLTVCVCAAHVTGRLQRRGLLFVPTQSLWTDSSQPHTGTRSKNSISTSQANNEEANTATAKAVK